jgi:hydroxylamine reductase (hybrid-cluster protein)
MIVVNMKSMAEKMPTTPIDADDFNSVLAHAKKAFPNLPTIQEMKSLVGGASHGTVLLKVSILQGAVEADWTRRIEELNQEATREAARQWGEFHGR